MYLGKNRVTVLIALVLVLLIAGCKKDPVAEKAKFTASGDKLMASEKFNEASIQYRNALKIDPNSSDLYYKLGEAYFHNSQLREAFASYKRATDLDKNNVQAQLAVARFYLVTRQFNEVIQLTSAALENHPDNIDLTLLLANGYAGKKDVPQGIKILQDLLAKHPESVSAHLNLGVFYVSQGKTDLERQEFEAAVKADPKSVDAHKAMAAYYTTQNQPENAEKELKAVADTSGGVPAKKALAEFYYRQKRFPEAEAIYKELIPLQNNSPEARVNLANFYLAQNRPEEAKKIDEQLAKDVPTFMPARLQLGEMAMQAHNLDEAEKVVTGILKDRSKEPAALVLYAQILLMKNQGQKAIEQLDAAQKFEPKSPTIAFFQGQAYSELGNLDRAQASYEQAISYDANFTRAYLSLAELMLATNRPDVSLKYSEQVLANDHNNVLATFLQANAYANMRNYPKAQEVFEKYSKLAPDSSQGPLRLGMLALTQKKFDVAEKDLDKALQMNPKEYDALSSLAALYTFQKKPDKAIARVQQQLQVDKSAAVYKILGKVYDQAGKYPEAEQALRQALAINPQDYSLHLLIGELYMQQKTVNKAIAEYDQAIKNNPKDAGIWTLYGMLNEQAGNQDVAKKAYERALDIDPNSGGAANNLANLYLKDNYKDLDKALELARVAKVALPQAAPVSDTLGWVYYNRKLYDSALPLIQEAVKQQPEKAEFHFHLAAVLLETGNKPQAKAELNTALKLDSSLKERDDVKKVMGELGA